MSVQHIYAKKAIGIADLRRSDSGLLDDLNEPIAILKRDMVKGYLISASLSNFLPKECYKIKLKDAGMRLVYAMSDDDFYQSK